MAFEIEITGIAFGGDGIGRKDGFVYFIPGTLPGELVTAQEVSRKKSYGRAVPLEILRSSQFRTEPICPLALKPGKGIDIASICPGCVYQHVTYDEELRLKNLQLVNFITRTLGQESERKIEPPIKSPCGYHYRNKLELHMLKQSGKTVLGYFSCDNKSLVDVHDCPLACNEINDCIRKIRPAILGDDTDGEKSRISFRKLPDNSAIHWESERDIKDMSILEKTVIGEIKTPLSGFFQVNPAICDILISEVTEKLKFSSAENVIDLYCGCGIFSMAAISAGAQRIIGADSSAKSIECARVNCEIRNFNGARFFTERVETAIQRKAFRTDPKKTTVILDPPRTGLGDKVIGFLNERRFSRVIYISCSPDTLVRDLARISPETYSLESVRLLDMFPRTMHFETIAVLGTKRT